MRTPGDKKRHAAQNDTKLMKEIAQIMQDFYGIDKNSVYHTLVSIDFRTKE